MKKGYSDIIICVIFDLNSFGLNVSWIQICRTPLMLFCLNVIHLFIPIEKRLKQCFMTSQQ